jgi:hypothetical protein
MMDSIAATGSAAAAFLWPDAFTTRLSDALDSVANAGITLGRELLARGEDALRHLHLIGHSLGTLVNAYAADFLTTRGVVVEQVTILDSPFGNGSLAVGGEFVTTGENLDLPVFQNLLAAGGVTYVDNYWGNGLTGRGGPMNPPTTADDQLIAGAGHGALIEWYQDNKRWDFQPTATWDPGIFTPATQELEINPISWLVNNCRIALGTATCHEGSPAYLWQSGSAIPTDAKYLRFDFLWNNKGDGDFLSVSFGDEVLFKFLGTSFDGSEFMNSGLIPISAFAGRTDQLLFMLNSTGGSNAQFSIRNVEFLTSVPEPNPLWLLLVGMLMLLAWQFHGMKYGLADVPSG